MSALAKISEGFTAGTIEDTIGEVITERRLAKVIERPQRVRYIHAHATYTCMYTVVDVV